MRLLSLPFVHLSVLYSVGMDQPKSSDKEVVRGIFNDANAGFHLGELNNLDVELEFLEDKENRWGKIFELLEGEDHKQ